ncbi:MAG TPA: hypothetical protein VMF89_34315, partial [Polyangiales bacterium]|nr:hypothetical protein [Polyangiales bacterium]
TRLMAMLPSRIGALFARNADIRLVKPPKPVPSFSEAMTWNSLYDNDPAHVWLRQQLKFVADQLAGNAVAEPKRTAAI